MKTPYEKIKADMLNMEKRAGLRRQVLIDSHALRKLLEDYERLATAAKFHKQIHPFKKLEDPLVAIIGAVWAETHDSRYVMQVVMEALSKIENEHLKMLKMERIYDR